MRKFIFAQGDTDREDHREDIPIKTSSVWGELRESEGIKSLPIWIYIGGDLIPSNPSQFTSNQRLVYVSLTEEICICLECVWREEVEASPTIDEGMPDFDVTDDEATRGKIRVPAMLLGQAEESKEMEVSNS